VRSPRKVTLLSLLPSSRELVVYADEKLTVFVEPEERYLDGIADAHRGDGKRFIVRADEKLSAFVELELAIRGS